MGDIDFKAISAAENSNKFQKTRFWKEKSVEDVVRLGPTAQATLVFLEITKVTTALSFTFQPFYSGQGEPAPTCHYQCQSNSPTYHFKFVFLIWFFFSISYCKHV